MAETKGKNFTIVIADDDTDDHYFLKEAIKQVDASHTCISVYNGLELMAHLHKEENKVDLVILDLNMPLLDGFGALEQIKANEQYKNIPVFVLSTTHFDYDIKKSKELGAGDFYCKPYHYDKLKEIVEDILLKTFATRS